MKRLALVWLAAVALLGGVSITRAWSGGPSGFQGGWSHGDGGYHGGWSHGYGGYHGSWSHGHGGYHGSVGVFIGAPWFWGPYYYPYPSPVYIEQAPPVYIQQTPPVYAEQEPYYWYYCQDPSGYYPYVQSCRREWLRVAPEPPPQQ